jgi:predicted GIY-YIG superfamily endonuclease
MSKHAAVQFNRELNKLFDQRTHWLRRAVKSTDRRRPPKFNRPKVDKTIDELQDLASVCVAEYLAQTEFLKLVVLKKQWHVKGHGHDQKRRNFDAWLRNNIPNQNFVYIFWNKRKCLYVGKTESGKTRPQDHFSKYWFPHATRIDIHAVNAPSEVLKLECLAKHRFKPTINRNDPPTKKWYKKCPVCEVHTLIHDEMRRIFGLKKS